MRSMWYFDNNNQLAIGQVEHEDQIANPFYKFREEPPSQEIRNNLSDAQKQGLVNKTMHWFYENNAYTVK